MSRRVVSGTACAILLLLGGCGPPVAAQEEEYETLTIELTGKRFWWDVWYRHPVPARHLRTASEVHIPVGQTVRLEIMAAGEASRSVWLPGLLWFPWRTGSFTLRAEEPGIYRGRSGDFWRVGRPRMEFLVIAEPPEQFAAWWERQLHPALTPADPLLARGQEVFLATGCSLCHVVRGTLAGGRVGPDLTHFGSRRTIAAGVIPNTRGHLAAWISDPQGIKPGNLMPTIPLEGENLQALIGYLHSLR